MSQFRFKVGDDVLIGHEGKRHYSPATIINNGALAPQEWTRVMMTSSMPNALPALVPANGDTRKEDLRCHIRYDGWPSWYDEVVEIHRVLKRPGADRNLGGCRMDNSNASVIASQENGHDMEMLPTEGSDAQQVSDDEVTILFTRVINGSELEARVEVEEFNYDEDVPQYLQALLSQDGDDIHGGKSQLCQGRFLGWSANDVLAQYLKSCKAQETPEEFNYIRRYVIQLRASMHKVIRKLIIFTDKECRPIGKLTDFATCIDKDILDLLPALYLLRLFNLEHAVPLGVRKEFHHAFLQFLVEKANDCFPNQVEAMNEAAMD